MTYKISAAVQLKLTETIVDGNFAKLIFQHTNFPFVLFLQNVVYEGRLSGSQESSNDGDGSEVALFGCHDGKMMQIGDYIIGSKHSDTEVVIPNAAVQEEPCFSVHALAVACVVPFQTPAICRNHDLPGASTDV